MFNFTSHLLFMFIVSVLSQVIAVQTVFADIYKYVDEEGVIHITNVPTEANANYVLILKERRPIFNINNDKGQYDHLIAKAAAKYHIDEALIKAVIKAESNFNHKAVSKAGARGLMQLMPATASSMNVHDSFHPENNINGGVKYLRYLLDLFKGNLPLALAAYNAGENAVLRFNSIPPYEETQNYVHKVLQYLNRYNATN
ncbi:MAG: lytic transglycosylase domain-containing protein [Deltaproteobacteria bacterium]|nr:lytic transglycosylase domain-containing protein [Deltaproteobacteria bacterium]